jgi:VWFA-related protein
MPRVLVAFAIISVSLFAQEQPPARAPQEQPFRSGAHYVRVDAYPAKDGRPLTGLTAADFELLEDGKGQTIDRVEFISHPAWTPVAERRDPNSQRDGFNLARDPKYRVFVLYLDAFHVDFAGSHRVSAPIGELLNRMMGPQDLFGVLTPAQTVKDLLLGQLTQTIEEQLATSNWGLADRPGLYQPGEAELEFVHPHDGKRLIALRRLDKVYSDLEELVVTLGSLREERKNIIFFSDSLVSPPSRFRDMAVDPDPRARGNPPGIGVSSEGQLTTGPRNIGDADRTRMGVERARLLSIDFDQRFRDLLRDARQANVAFYTVRPGGLDVGSSAMSNLRTLAEQTDGIAVLDTNDLRAGLGKVADDLSSHYVLGFYTSNTRWDGQPRKLTVRLKATGETVRARREYRAPTEAEMASIRDARAGTGSSAAPSPVQAALSALSRISPSQRIQAYGTATGADLTIVAEIAPAEIEAGRWKTGGDVEVLLTGKDGQTANVSARIEPGTRSALVTLPVGVQEGPWQAVVKVRGADQTTESDTVAIERPDGTLIGRPIAYRAASAAASAYKPLATFVFRRTERVRLEWPVAGPLDAHQARLLDRNGKPVAVPVPTSIQDGGGTRLLRADLNLAPLSGGEFLIEVTANGGGKSDQQIVAIRVNMAR